MLLELSKLLQKMKQFASLAIMAVAATGIKLVAESESEINMDYATGKLASQISSNIVSSLTQIES